MQFEHWVEGIDYKVLDFDDGISVVFIAGSHCLFSVSSQTAARLSAGVNRLDREERREWHKLTEIGLISDCNARCLSKTTPHDGANLAINMNLTPHCNLACSYCFARGGNYGRLKEEMKPGMLAPIFDFIREHVTRSGIVRFEFFGGEPLLNFKLIKEVCKKSETFSEKTGINFIYRISTNLTWLSQEVLDLFARHKFIVSVSIDGGKETHNRNRPGRNGKPWFDTIIENCRKVRAADEDIIMAARMTVCDHLVPLHENVFQLWKYNMFDYFQIYPAGIPPGNECREQISPGIRREFIQLMNIYPTLFKQGNRFRGIIEYERIAEMILEGKFALAYCSAGRNYYTFSADQSIVPCHRLAGDVTFRIGDTNNGLTGEPVKWRLPVDGHPVCRKCWIRYICAGGCKQQNLAAAGDINTPSPAVCTFEVDAVTGMIHSIVKAGRDYRAHNRDALENMFVSCGRPVVRNNRCRLPGTGSKPGTGRFIPIMNDIDCHH